ncbi:NAD-dependent protein deacylase, partial [Mycobacterium sp. ITM-2017-0098]
QNVDNLHERAGSSQVHHVHGSLFEFHCDRCRSTYQGQIPDMPGPVESIDPPSCPACGGLIRPNVVWFGEPLPDDAWQQSVEAVAK